MSLSGFLGLAVLIAFTRPTESKLPGCGDSPIVTVAQGALRGRRNLTEQGTEYFLFLGIPYASPPVGQQRFVAPKPLKKWSGVRNASSFGSPCYQLESNVIHGDEDCLFVNVFTPKLPCSNTTRLPVMVWIHGGAFVSGSGNIYPGQLLEHGVVIVSMNYRLNVFGFLSVEGTNATGNAGLKDQSAALRWVRKNIANFGGNPYCVSIFGESAGGASVHYHMLSPMSTGLFRRAISESASALSPWAFTCRTHDRAYRLGNIVGRGANSSQDLMGILRATPARKLTGALSEVLTTEESKRLLSFPFMPSMEYSRVGEKPFLSQSPACIEFAGSFRKIPYIIGVNIREATLFTDDTAVFPPSYWKNINDDLEQIVPLNLGLEKGSQESIEVAEKIKEFYFGEKNISYENRNLWTDLQSDLLFVLGVETTVRSHARYSRRMKTYNYQFIYHNATHTDELQYVFYPGKIDGGSTDDKSRVVKHFASMWTSFAKYGVPDSEEDFSWTPVKSKTFPFLQLSESLIMESNLENDEIDFWRNIYTNYAQSRPCCS